MDVRDQKEVNTLKGGRNPLTLSASIQSKLYNNARLVWVVICCCRYIKISSVQSTMSINHRILLGFPNMGTYTGAFIFGPLLGCAKLALVVMTQELTT